MEEKGSEPASARCASMADLTHEETALFLSLPVEVLHQVLGMLDTNGLLQLLQTSKVMAQHIMQHYSGKLTLNVRLQLQHHVNMAGIRQLLQWAPPACLKLMLDGQQELLMLRRKWEPFSTVFGEALTDTGSHQDQRFLSLLGLEIHRFVLPSLVPAGLAAACPNLNILHLRDCDIINNCPGCSSSNTSYSTSNSTSTSTSSTSSSSSSSSSHTNASCNVNGPSASVCPAYQLHTLVLEDVTAPSLRMQPAAPYVEQLRNCVPNVRCLKLTGICQVEFIQLLGPQLRELHVTDWGKVKIIRGMRQQLQQLQRLVAPCAKVAKAADMEFLLSLPSLTHVELDSVDLLPKDYSDHPCRWQFLQLHCLNHFKQQSLVALSKLPFHFLTQPLILGSQGSGPRLILQPAAPQALTALQCLTQHLTKCGVKVLAPALSWVADRVTVNGVFSRLQTGAELAPALQMAAPAFRHCKHIQLCNIIIDQPILEAVAAGYQDSLQSLTLHSCLYTADMQPAWHAAMSGLPALQYVGLQRLTRGGFEMLDCVRSLAAAMAQQPAGRCIEVAEIDPLPGVPVMLPELVLDGAEELLAGVKVVAGHVGCLLISSQ